MIFADLAAGQSVFVDANIFVDYFARIRSLVPIAPRSSTASPAEK
jgi:hypothetical protein